MSLNNTRENTAEKPSLPNSKTTATSLDAASVQKDTPLTWRICGHKIKIAIIFLKTIIEILCCLLLSELWHYSPFLILPRFFLNCKSSTFFFF